MVKENSEQFDFGNGGMTRRDSQGSRRKNKGRRQNSKKSKKKNKDRHDDEGEGGVRVEELPPRLQVRVRTRTVHTKMMKSFQGREPFIISCLQEQ